MRASRRLSSGITPPQHCFERTAEPCSGGGLAINEPIFSKLEQRLGRLHAKLRLGIETDHEAQIFGQGINFFHIENWYSVHSVIRTTLKLMGLYWRGCKNAEQIQVKHNHICMKTLPSRFDGFSLLHISDLHVEMNKSAMRRLTELLPELTYDVCVLTGDYRGGTFGPFDAALEGLARVRSHLKGPVYGVLGNHDTIRMIPGLEEIGVRMLLNECEKILRDDQLIYLAGIDRCALLPSRQYRKGSIRNSRQWIFNPAVAYAGNLPPGSTCRFRSATERPYSWRSDLSAWVYPDHS